MNSNYQRLVQSMNNAVHFQFFIILSSVGYCCGTTLTPGRAASPSCGNRSLSTSANFSTRLDESKRHSIASKIESPSVDYFDDGPRVGCCRANWVCSANRGASWMISAPISLLLLLLFSLMAVMVVLVSFFHSLLPAWVPLVRALAHTWCCVNLEKYVLFMLYVNLGPLEKIELLIH
uniref:Uncharacterized protein n=1 Tax=Glossina pallidipes TaxID=7398 RepID=A0A1A9ZP24_GLOPL